MLRSMTGFARCDAGSSFGDLNWEIRGVNHRYLDVQLRLPEELRAYEAKLRRQIGDSVSRGKIDCGFYVKRAGPSDARVTLNDATLNQLEEVLETLASKLSSLGKTNPLEILRWPGVIEDTPVEPEALYEEASKLLGEALVSFTEMRSREGERLTTMLLDRCDAIQKIGVLVRTRRPIVIEAMRAKVHERLERILADIDPSRIEAEVVLLAQKLDVDEELDRLDSHLIEVRSVIGRDEPNGRRLDFLMQELNREANTLASKSADAETTRASVDLKVLIEQMREQVQNVE